MPQRVLRHVQSHWGAHPYRHCFIRAMITAALRTAAFQQLAHGHILGLLITEFFMALNTSSNVGLRTRSDHMKRFDWIWASGAVCGVAIGIVSVHFTYHRYDALWWNPLSWGVFPLPR